MYSKIWAYITLKLAGYCFKHHRPSYCELCWYELEHRQQTKRQARKERIEAAKKTLGWHR